MENFMLYEEIGKGKKSVAHKGRRKGSITFVAIICNEKSKRAEVANHVRLSHNLKHNNIVAFHEWYESSNHLWLVVELCTGGSLQSLIAQDVCLPEKVVRQFAIDLVMGLKYIHDIGIIVCNITPAKILLDGPGTLKYSNFCLSKAKGEDLQKFFTMVQSETKEVCEATEKETNLESVTYTAPEVLAGADFSPQSDLWALGCIFYEMFTGKPPFCSPNPTKLVELIQHNDPTHPKQSGAPFAKASPEFQSLLIGLLRKNPEERLSWQQVLPHPFWGGALTEDDTSQTFRSSTDLLEDRQVELLPQATSTPITVEQPGVKNGAETAGRSSQALRKSYRLDSVADLKPKSAEDGNAKEPVFLLSSRPAPVKRSMADDVAVGGALTHISTPSQENRAGDVNTETLDIKDLVYTDSDLTVTPIIDNPKILKPMVVKYDPRTLSVPAHSVEKLLSLSQADWETFVQQLCSALESGEKSRSKLNLLCYLCTLATHKQVSTRLINSHLFPLLTQQLRGVSNWDVKTKVMRVQGLVAAHCLDLKEVASVAEAVLVFTELIRENFRNSKLKMCLLPPLGELLYLAACQEEKKESPGGLWTVPAASYTVLMRCLQEREDLVINHIAAKTVENVCSTSSRHAKAFITGEIGPMLWFLFTHSTVDSLRVTAISALSRITRHSASAFQSVIDKVGMPAILGSLVLGISRIQQHMLTMFTAILSSGSNVQRLVQEREFVAKVMRCLESPFPVIRAKAFLVLLHILKLNRDMLLLACNTRLVMYIERDIRKATPGKEQQSSNEYLSKCLDLLIRHVVQELPAILDDILSALSNIAGRKHPSTLQAKQLKQCLPMMAVMVYVLTSQVFRPQVMTKEFLIKSGTLLNFINSVDKCESSLDTAVGQTASEELIRSMLSAIEAIAQDSVLLTSHHATVVESILPPLASLVFSKNVEWKVVSLRVLSDITLILLSHHEEEEEEEEESDSALLALITHSLLPQYESLLFEPDPLPAYALKLLMSLTEHSSPVARLIEESRLLPVIFQVLLDQQSNMLGSTMQCAVGLLSNLTSQREGSAKFLCREGLASVIRSVFIQASALFLEGGDWHSDKHCSILLVLLEVLHSVLKAIYTVVRQALQAQKCEAGSDTQLAEQLLLINKPLADLICILIQMLSCADQEVYEESSQCLSLLVQLYGVDELQSLSPNILHSLSRALEVQTDPKQQRLLLRVIKRLVTCRDRSTSLTNDEDLHNTLQSLASCTRSHSDVTIASLATEILRAMET